MARSRVVELRFVPASELVPNPKNWRTHPTKQKEALRALLDEVGVADAVIARPLPDGRLMLVDGHLRQDVSGSEPLPVLVVDLDEAEADKVLLTLDPVAAMATADAARLDALLREVQTGSEAVAHLLADLKNQATKDTGRRSMVEDVAPKPPRAPRTKFGQTWKLGAHRLVCGDSTRAPAIQQALAGERADMVFTDPPYDVNVKGGGKQKAATMIAGDLTQTVIPFAFELAVNVATKADARLYFCGGEGNLYLYQRLFERHCQQLPRHLIWVKNGFTMKPNGYHNQYEIIFHGFKPGGGALKRWYGARTEDAASDVWHIARDAPSTYEHPTQKPVALPARAIENSCPIGGIVFEPFAGAGSTYLAAEHLGRRCYGLELDPRFCDVVVARWENATGKVAELES